MAEKKSLILDLHIPYGITPIRYIGGMQAQGSNEEKNAYLMALMKEVVSYEEELEGYEIRAIRLGGGAATVMKPDLLGQLLATVRKRLPVAEHAEVSFDALPNTVGTPSLTGIAFGNPNRAELMMRSYREEDLRALACPFTLQNVQNAILFFGKFHMNNLGMTVHYGIPSQTLKDWEFTVKSCINMRPAHISALPLAVTDAEGMPSEEERFAMFSSACTLLEEAGYLHYQAGLFCLPRHEYRFEALLHNGCELLGLGANAVSTLDGFLTRNTNNLRLYIHNAGDLEKTTAQALPLEEAALQKRYAAGRLHMAQGLIREQYEKRFGAGIPEELRSSLSRLAEAGLLEETAEAYVPTLSGLFHAEKADRLLLAE